MKRRENMLRRLGAVALALTLALTAGQMAFASDALGSELVERKIELAQGVSLNRGSLWSASRNDLRTEHYVTYTPGQNVTPMVFSGNYVASTNTVAAAAGQMERQGYRVVAGINGGFFNTDGTIVGMLMTDGVIRSLDVENYTLLGFSRDGSVFVDESALTKTVVLPGADGISSYTTSLAGFNAYRNRNYLDGLYLYNQDFSSRVNSSGDSVSVLLQPVGDSAQLTMNGTLSLEVVSVTDTKAGDRFNGVLPEGGYMLYANDSENQSLLGALRRLRAGQQVTVSVSGGSGRWNTAAYGISIMTVLLRDGQVASGLGVTTNPYTALGVKADGSVVLYTIDGRQSGYSVGANHGQVARRLQELGCVSAVALDGGGSTALGATLPGSGNFSIISRPTGSRAVNNSILLVTPNTTATGQLGGYYLSGETQVMLAGADLTVRATPYDTAGYPMTAEAPIWQGTGGTLEGSGLSAVYTAGNVPGTFELSAKSQSGSAGGTLPVRVVDSLSRLTISREETGGALTALTVSAGGQAALTAKGIWWNLPVGMDDTDVVWRADAAIGTIDQTGLFTAGYSSGTGTITATAGGKTVAIRVTVKGNSPFTDIAGHWSAGYVERLYQLGITTGIAQADGSYIFQPRGRLSRGELLVFITRLLGVDTTVYERVELPFADAGSIPGWVLPSVKAMYALQVFEGGENGGRLTANVGELVTREAAMVMLGRVLASNATTDLSVFADRDQVSGWAVSQVQKLVALGVVQGSDGYLSPTATIDRASAAKLLVEVHGLEKLPLIVRPGLG